MKMAVEEAYKPPPPSADTMNAVRFHGQNDLRYERIPVPQIRQGQVKIRPSWVGICGSGPNAVLNGFDTNTDEHRPS